MSIFFGLLFARRFYCRSALSLSPGRTGGLFPRINAPIKNAGRIKRPASFLQRRTIEVYGACKLFLFSAFIILVDFFAPARRQRS